AAVGSWNLTTHEPPCPPRRFRSGRLAPWTPSQTHPRRLIVCSLLPTSGLPVRVSGVRFERVLCRLQCHHIARIVTFSPGSWTSPDDLTGCLPQDGLPGPTEPPDCRVDS
ncbi:hypothetical protein CTAM01_03846, partial [Colletotrichum tamarilloi]